MIPEEKQPALARALYTAFGVTESVEFHPLTGGLSSAFAFEMVVKGHPYLLKILRTEPINGPANEFACMQTAAVAAIDPRIWYASAADRLLITDFVEARPFPADMLPLIVPTLRTLHSLPDFQKPKMGSYLDAADGFVRRFQAAKRFPDSATEELFRRYADLVKAYPRNDADLVASHNDLKPQNLRFDGNRLWLVDWESSFLNDEYVDLSIVANFFVKDEAREESFLSAYFGQPAGEYRRARFFLMSQIVSMFYASFLLLEAARVGLTIAVRLTTPSFREYHQDLLSDKINMLSPDAKLQYGMIHLREDLRNMRTPRFEQSFTALDRP